jgi:hypothetical protein
MLSCLIEYINYAIGIFYEIRVPAIYIILRYFNLRYFNLFIVELVSSNRNGEH